MVSKKAQIERLIAASKEEWANPSKSHPAKKNPRSSQQLQQRQSPFQVSVPPPPKGCSRHREIRRAEPKPVVPGLPEPNYLILDCRHQDFPERPLVRIPQATQTTPFKPTGQFPFLELPGELRNKVYDLVINRRQYSIEWVKNTPRSKSLTFNLVGVDSMHRDQPHLHDDVAKHRRALDYRHRWLLDEHIKPDRLRPTPTSMLLTCKTMHFEAASVFYSKSTFAFHRIGTMRHFLDHLTPIAKTSITKLHLHYRAYGNPALTQNIDWKYKHDRAWEQICWRVTDECTSLTHLNLELELNKSPISFARFDCIEDSDIGAQWIRPLWAFQDVGIKRCRVKIICPGAAEAVLKDESRAVRKQILGEM